MTNPFESEDASYVVLINSEHQHSLWPAEMEIPPGWSITKSADTRQACLQFIEETWTDMRPRSLAEWMDNTTER